MRDQPVNITVATYDRIEKTRKCLTSLLALTQGNFKVHVVDNASADGTWEFVTSLAAEDSRVQAFRLARNMGVATAANYGWALADNAYYVKLDNDVEILQGDWLLTLLGYLDRNPEIGVIGYHFLERHVVTPITLASGDLFWEYGTCGGACIMIPPKTHAELGYWTEDYGKYGHEDMDFSLRCRLHGLKTGYAPLEGKVMHTGHEDICIEYEERKNDQVQSNLVGERIFFMNKLFFEEGARKLYVPRRLLPIANTFPVRFTSNPEYAGINKLYNALRASIQFQRKDDKVVLDFSKWKTE